MSVVLRLWVWLGSEPTAVGRWLALMLTYFGHALLWAGMAALLARRSSLAASTRHWLWRMALFGPLLTTALTTLLPRSAVLASGSPALLQELFVAPKSYVPANTSAAGEVRTGAPDQDAVVASLAALALALGLLRFAISAGYLRRLLRTRTPVRDAAVLRQTADMCIRMGIRPVTVSQSAHIGSPLVIGLRELCLPRALLTTLAEPELAGVLAHELAHIERRDGLWFPLVGLVQSVLWMQPLNHVVAPRIRSTSEMACDDRAVTLTGDPRSLALALTQVAAGLLRDRPPALVPAMARATPTLLHRVERLTAAARVPVGARAGYPSLVILVVLGIAICSVGVDVSQIQPPPPDAVAAGDRLNVLAQGEREIRERLALALGAHSAIRVHTSAASDILELEQELRHTQTQRAWTEQRFVDASAAWQRRWRLPAGERVQP